MAFYGYGSRIYLDMVSSDPVVPPLRRPTLSASAMEAPLPITRTSNPQGSGSLIPLARMIFGGRFGARGLCVEGNLHDEIAAVADEKAVCRYCYRVDALYMLCFTQTILGTLVPISSGPLESPLSAYRPRSPPDPNQCIHWVPISFPTRRSSDR